MRKVITEPSFLERFSSGLNRTTWGFPLLFGHGLCPQFQDKGPNECREPVQTIGG